MSDEEPPNPMAFLGALFGGADKEAEAAQDKQRMEVEANELRLHNFIDGLSDDQLDTLLWLTKKFATEGQHNYFTLMVYGLLKREQWHRKSKVAVDA